MAEIPEKPYYKLNEVCQFTDTQPYVLRFWESEFPQLAPEKGRSGQPIYRRRDIDLVLRIKRLLQDEEQSISVAREILEANADGVPLAEAPVARPEVEAAAAPVADEPVAAAPPPRPDERQESLSFDSVPRHRYDDAVDEVQHLKLELSDAEQRLRKAESAAKKLEEANLRLREKTRRAAAVIEELLDRLS